MAHFVKLENNIVIDVVAVNNDDINNLEFPESESVGVDFLTQLFGDSNWIQTSVNSNFRKKYASIGDTYDPIKDQFVSPKPHNSWVFNEEKHNWQAPILSPSQLDPSNDYDYEWDEETLSWVQII